MGGYNCYKKDLFYSQCLTSCPMGWICPRCNDATETTPAPLLTKVLSTKIAKFNSELDSSTPKDPASYTPQSKLVKF